MGLAHAYQSLYAQSFDPVRGELALRQPLAQHLPHHMKAAALPELVTEVSATRRSGRDQEAHDQAAVLGVERRELASDDST